MFTFMLNVERQSLQRNDCDLLQLFFLASNMDLYQILADW